MTRSPAVAVKPATQADGRRASIQAAAAKLFDVHGVDRVSMDQIAKAVGLAKPTLYHYFKSKEQILYALHEDMFTLILSRLEERMAGGGGPEAQLLGVFNDIFEGMDSHPGHTRVFFEHFRQLNADYRKRIRKSERKYKGLIEGILTSGIEEGAFRPMDVRLASLALLGMVNWSYQWYSPDGTHTPAQLAEKFYGNYVEGIGVARKR